MADTNFGKIIEKLQDIHNKYPDLQFGFIVQSALDKVKNSKNVDFHSMNSKEINTALDIFEVHIQNIKNQNNNKKILVSDFVRPQEKKNERQKSIYLEMVKNEQIKSENSKTTNESK